MNAPFRALVFGGSGTLGRVVCRKLAEQGAHVAFTWHTNGDAARELEALIPGAFPRRVDLTSMLEVEGAIDDAAARLGGIDAFVHCAGVGTAAGTNASGVRVTLADIDEPGWDRTMAVNLKAAFFAVRRLVRVMRGAGGNVVLVGSIDGVKPMPTPAHHAASKAALVGMAQAMAKELGRHDIRVNVVAPGLMEGGLSRFLPAELRAEYLEHCGLRRLGRPEEVASVVVWMAMRNTYVTGRALVLDGGL